MAKKRTSSIDMFEELFIPEKPEPQTYKIPMKAEEEYWDELESKDDKVSHFAVFALTELNRRHHRYNAGNKSDKTRDRFIGRLKDASIRVPGITEQAGIALVRLGMHCESIRDYESARAYYEAALEYNIGDVEYLYYKYNNLGFCLNVLERFNEAEGFLFQATQIAPMKYNAWKNLGVSLEHQGRIVDAAENYLKAVQITGGEHRSIMHLKRLIDRNPVLKKERAIKDFVADFKIWQKRRH